MTASRFFLNCSSRWLSVPRLVPAIGPILLLAASPEFALASDSPRERTSLNQNWRFVKGDPTNNTVSLLYDVRQAQTIRRIAEAEADGNSAINESANESTPRPPAVIKPWILP